MKIYDENGKLKSEKSLNKLMDKFEKKWQASQINHWQEDRKKIVDFFLRFGLNIDDLYDHITKLDYDRMQIICYLLSKNKKAVKICDFLDELKKENHEDVDVIKIFFLICHVEITMNSLRISGSNIDPVSKFFKTVEEKYGLKYNIRTGLGTGKEGESYAWILSRVRNVYVHTGEYTGNFFRDPDAERDVYNVFTLKDRGQYVEVECNLTYQEFINIYMDALIENIKSFSEESKSII